MGYDLQLSRQHSEILLQYYHFSSILLLNEQQELPHGAKKCINLLLPHVSFTSKKTVGHYYYYYFILWLSGYLILQINCHKVFRFTFLMNKWRPILLSV